MLGCGAQQEERGLALLGLFHSSPEVCEGSYGIPRHGLHEGLTSMRDDKTVVR